MTTAAAFDLDSTLVRRGVQAATLTEMAVFVDTLQGRPLDKLLAELPGLAALSEMKFSLARQVIRRRVRSLSRIDREQLRALAHEVADATGGETGEKIRAMFSYA
jgi:phosphoserine phosphatase